jgi:hypothetical protein
MNTTYRQAKPGDISAVAQVYSTAPIFRRTISDKAVLYQLRPDLPTRLDICSPIALRGGLKSVGCRMGSKVIGPGPLIFFTR